MPLEIVTEGVLGFVGRLIGWIFVDFLLEIMVKGLGSILCRPFKKVNADGWLCILIGLIGWVVIVSILYWLVHVLSVQLAIDTCFDSGGKYDYEFDICLR